MLWPPTISFELRVNVADEIDLEMCSCGQLSELQMVPDLDLWWGQGHTNTHITCSTSSLPNSVTVASRTTEIWPFEYREISTLDEVWTLVIAFLEGNLKSGLRQAVVHVPYYDYQPSVLNSARKRRGDRPSIVHFSQLRKVRDLYLDLRSVEVTLVRIRGRGLPTHEIRWKSEKKTFCGRMDGWTSGRTHRGSNLLGYR